MTTYFTGNFLAIRDSGVSVFEAHYAGAPGAGWEIGRPQPVFERLAAAGAFRGPLLDVGCGSGDNALLTASLGIETVGVDAAPTGLDLARTKAVERGLDVSFLQWDALQLPLLGQTFETVIDCGLLHCFAPEDRPGLATSLHAVLAPGGRYFVLSWSDLQPGDWGPRRVSQDAVRETFMAGWRIDRLEHSTIEVAFGDGTVHATFAEITRL